MKAFAFSPKSKQRGIAALFVAVILLIAVTLLVMFASRVALLDQRTSANEYRHSQAFAMAEAGLEQAAAFLRENPILHGGDLAAAPGWENHAWTGCADVDLPPCDDASVEQVLVETVDGVAMSGVREPLVPGTSDPVIPQATAFLVRTDTGRLRGIGVGESDDGTGEAVVQVDFGLASIISPGEIPPLMTPYANLLGNFSVVPNPNGGGPGVPVSVWAINPKDSPGGGNWKTCDHGDFRTGGSVCMDTLSGSQRWKDGSINCDCSSERSNDKDRREDIVIYPEEDLDKEFPESPFTYVFGDPENDTLDGLRPQIKTLAEASGLVLPNCDNLFTAFNGLEGSALVWIENDCSLPSKDTLAEDMIGSRDKPIILVVEGDLTVNAGAELWGLVVGLGDSMALNGGPIIHGAMVSENATDLTNGTYTQVYDEGVFQNLLDERINTQLTKLSYSWRDFRP